MISDEILAATFLKISSELKNEDIIMGTKMRSWDSLRWQCFWMKAESCQEVINLKWKSKVSIFSSLLYSLEEAGHFHSF